MAFWVECSLLLLILLHVYSLHAYICSIIAIIIIAGETRFWVVQCRYSSFFILHFFLFFFFQSLCTISKPSANLFAYYFNGSHSFPTAGKILNERDWKDCDLFSTFRTIYMNHFIGGNKSGRVNNNNKFIRNEICTFTGISWRKISCSQ